MRLPPHIEQHVRETLVREADGRRCLARGWIILGSLGVAFIGAMAVAHYVYGVPVHDRNTGELSTPANTLKIFTLIGGGAALFLVLGVLLHRWKPD